MLTAHPPLTAGAELLDEELLEELEGAQGLEAPARGPRIIFARFELSKNAARAAGRFDIGTPSLVFPPAQV